MLLLMWSVVQRTLVHHFFTFSKFRRTSTSCSELLKQLRKLILCEEYSIDPMIHNQVINYVNIFFIFFLQSSSNESAPGKATDASLNSEVNAQATRQIEIGATTTKVIESPIAPGITADSPVETETTGMTESKINENGEHFHQDSIPTAPDGAATVVDCTADETPKESPESQYDWWHNIPIGVSTIVDSWESIVKKSIEQPQRVTLIRIESDGIKGFRKIFPDGSTYDFMDGSNNCVAENFELYVKVSTDPSPQVDANLENKSLDPIPALTRRSNSPQFQVELHEAKAHGVFLGSAACLNPYKGYGYPKGGLLTSGSVEILPSKAAIVFRHIGTPYFGPPAVKLMGEPKANGLLADGRPDPRSAWVVPSTRIKLLGGFTECSDDLCAYFAHAVFSGEVVEAMRTYTEGSKSWDRMIDKGATVEAGSIRLTPGGELWAISSIVVLPPNSKSDINVALKASTGTNVFAIGVHVGGLDHQGIPALFPELGKQEILHVCIIPATSLTHRVHEHHFRYDENDSAVIFSSASLLPLNDQDAALVSKSTQLFLETGIIDEASTGVWHGLGKGRASKTPLMIQVSSGIVLRNSVAPPANTPTPKKKSHYTLPSPQEAVDDDKKKKKKKKSKDSSEIDAPAPTAFLSPPAADPAFLSQFGEVAKALVGVSTALCEKVSSASSSSSAAVVAIENAVSIARLQEQLSAAKAGIEAETRMRLEVQKLSQQHNQETQKMYQDRLKESGEKSDEVAALLFRQQAISQQNASMFLGTGQLQSFHHQGGYFDYVPSHQGTSSAKRHRVDMSIAVPEMIRGGNDNLLLEAGPTNAMLQHASPPVSDTNIFLSMRSDLMENKELLKSGILTEEEFVDLKVKVFARFKLSLQQPSFSFTKSVSEVAEWKKLSYITEEDFKDLKEAAIAMK